MTTVVVGVIGTDGTSRTMASLVAKARGLIGEGVTYYSYAGHYHIPTKTLTFRMEDGILPVEVICRRRRHRHLRPSLFPTRPRQPRQSGLCHPHRRHAQRQGGHRQRRRRQGMLGPLILVSEKTEDPIMQFLPTHTNRNPDLFGAGIAYAKRGGYVDFATSTTPMFLEEGEAKCDRAIKTMLEEGVPPSQMTMSSDAQGSLPEFDAAGEFVGLGVGKVTTLHGELRDAVRDEGSRSNRRCKRSPRTPPAS